MHQCKRLLVGLVLLGSAFFVLPGGGGAAAASTPHATQRPLVDWNCYSAGRVEPGQIILACGDGNAVALHLRWQHWTSSGATAVGILSQNNCTPDCADGTFHAYPASFTLSEKVPVGASDYFTKVTIAFTRASPTHRKVEVVKDCFDTPSAAYIPKCPADLQN